MNSSDRLIRPLVGTALVLCFVVVVLGAYVRLSAAGLGCPDWPGCYGHLSPAGVKDPATGAIMEVGKAWREMIHRYAAGTLTALIGIIAALAIQNRRRPVIPVPFALGLLGLVIAQALLGMLTVTWQLNPWIVTGHLLCGLATLSLLWWQTLTLTRRRTRLWRMATPFLGSSLPRTRLLALLALCAVAVQIALGGWTSSHYAATACPDFPRCQGEWLPPLHGNVAIHLLHRIGALLTCGMLVAATARVMRIRNDQLARQAALAVLTALGLQLTLGVLMVVRGFPLGVATAHNAGAALLLLATLALNHSLRPA